MSVTALLTWVLIIGFLGWTAVYDARKLLLPLEPLWVMLVLGIVFRGFTVSGGFSDALLGAFFWGAWTGGLWFLSRGKWIGFADIWLTAATGAWIGIKGSLEAWYFTYVAVGLVIAFLVLLQVVKKDQKVPFAPMLLAGVLLAFFSQGRLLAWFAQGLFG